MNTRILFVSASDLSTIYIFNMTHKATGFYRINDQGNIQFSGVMYGDKFYNVNKELVLNHDILTYSN